MDFPAGTFVWCKKRGPETLTVRTLMFFLKKAQRLQRWAACAIKKIQRLPRWAPCDIKKTQRLPRWAPCAIKKTQRLPRWAPCAKKDTETSTLGILCHKKGTETSSIISPVLFKRHRNVHDWSSHALTSSVNP